MADEKRRSKKQRAPAPPTSSSTAPSTEASSGPVVSRPRMPPEYGIPKDIKGLLPWSHVSERMAQSKHYWVCTASADGQPHATPVDGLWIDGRLYFGGSPQTKRNRNMRDNPAVCVHLGDAMDVVILQGRAEELRTVDRELAERLVRASKEKYGYAPNAEDLGKGGTFVFRPRLVMAWKSFPQDVTRWQFPDE